MNAMTKSRKLALDFTSWPSVQTPDAEELQTTTWSALVAGLHTPEGMPPQGKHSLRLWNLGVFENNYRKQNNHRVSHGVLIDYDSDAEQTGGARGNIELSREDLQACFGHFQFAAHTTPSHKQGQARWRVIIPLDRPVNTTEYKQICHWLMEHAEANAISHVVGTLVDSHTIVENDELVKDEVLSYSAGFVEKFDVVNQSVAGGLVTVTMKATVQKQKVALNGDY
jgi:hypothetical protein